MDTSHRPRSRRRTINAISLSVIGACLVIFAAFAIGGALTGPGAPSAKYTAHVQDQLVINPADLAVTIRVTNSGKAAGTPECTVQASDPGGAYTGTDVGTLNSPIKAGAFAVYVDNVTITGQGAGYVTQVSVSCT